VKRRRKLSIKAQEWVDERIEAKVLTMMLDSYPGSRTMPELVRVLGADRDQINRALCALADYGLLEFEGGKTETLRPTLAARSCQRLLDAAGTMQTLPPRAMP
jgi:predicted transcriptional regulator